MRVVHLIQLAAASVIALWLASAAFVLASRQFDMAQPSFVIAYWGVPVVADLVLIASLIVRSRWRTELALLHRRNRSLLSGGLWLSAGLTPVVVVVAISGAAAAIGVMAEDQNRFVGTALFASIPIFLLGLFALLMGAMLWPRVEGASHRSA